MKILLAAPQDRTSQGVIAGYVQRALTSLGHEVLCFDFRKRPYSEFPCISSIKRFVRAAFPRVKSPYDLKAIKISVDRKINSALLKQLSEFGPEVLLVLLGENIDVNTLEIARKESRAVTVNWMLDTLLLPYRAELMRQVGAGYDFLFMVDDRGILDKVNVPVRHIYSLPTACQPEVHRKRELSDQEKEYYGSDVAFVGTMTPVRQQVLESLTGFDLKIWGRWEKKSPFLKRCYRKKDIYEEEAAKVYAASRIVVDIHGQWNLGPVVYNVTPRVFEVPACGGFLLTTLSAQLQHLYEIGKEMVVFDDPRDLKQKIRYFLDHPQERTEIVERAAAKARSQHTYVLRLTELLDIIRRNI
jgi:spore maturation protein CgeB